MYGGAMTRGAVCEIPVGARRKPTQTLAECATTFCSSVGDRQNETINKDSMSNKHRKIQST